jgi:hypothetical protein
VDFLTAEKPVEDFMLLGCGTWTPHPANSPCGREPARDCGLTFNIFVER